MAGKGRSVRGMFGTIHHYDEHGRRVGRSVPRAFGGYTNYDARGNLKGRSNPGLFGTYNHYDVRGRRMGQSRPGTFGGYNHYNSSGRQTGHSRPGMAGYHHSDQGCYVATCVYGSYDCPQVWTLRRFRDNTLAATLCGRAFIRAYYAVSPTVVRLFGDAAWFRRFWKGRLDGLVARLRAQGVADSPYEDLNW